MSRFSLAVDGTALFRRQPTGVDRYARGIVRALVQVRPDWDVVVARWRTPAPSAYDVVDGGAVRVRTSVVPRYGYRLAELARFSVPIDVATRIDADAWLFPDFVALPLRRARPNVTVVHDLSFRLALTTGLRMHRTYLARQVARAMSTSTIVAVSGFVRDQLVAAYRISPRDVQVVSPGVDLDVFRPSTEPERQLVRAALALDRPYLLSVGALHPRKNVPRLIAAYAALGDLARSHDLVLAGPVTRYSEGELAAIDAYPGPGRVRRLGFVDEVLMPALYSEAVVTVEASLYEGFGIPVLEALACGSPVVAASGSALVEAGGDAAVYVDPYDNAELTAALRALLSDPRRRDERSEAGVRWAGQHGWAASGEQMAQVLERAQGA